MKPSQVRIRVTDEDAVALDDLSGGVLLRTDVASVRLRAVAEAVRKSKGKVYFPPKFSVEL